MSVAAISNDSPGIMMNASGGASAKKICTSIRVGTYKGTNTYPGPKKCADGLKNKPGKRAEQGRWKFAEASGRAVVKGDARVSLSPSGMFEIIDTIDRPADAFTKGTYADTDTYAVGLENKPGKRIPKAGAIASAGVGYARAEWSIFEAEAKGPNASAGAEASAGSLSASAFARAEVASASASAGPLKATVGLSVDTGITVGVTQIEAKVLGCGISVGGTMGISLFGTGFEFHLW